ncbi:hypothetical protein FOA52_014607 [Chlamydomonas sp. UWO 241]|nr:hypothetical protein FOA52_014607 [Chlamydomonas sp. UWO 241]
MGACLSSDVESKYAVGGSNDKQEKGGDRQEAAEASSLVTGSAAYSSWVEVQVSCTNLKSADTFSKSDPMCVLMELTRSGWREVGRTEVIANNESPAFVKKFRLLYNFEAVQELKMHIVDVDPQHAADRVPVAQCNNLGLVEFKLSGLLTADNKTLALSVTGTTHKGSMVRLIGEEVSSAREVLTIQLAATGLRNIETFSKSDPFLEISRANEGGAWVPVFKTEVKDNNLNPVWNSFTIKATQLNNGDPYRSLRIRVFDYEANGKHRLLGEATTSAVKLKEMVDGKALAFVMPGDTKPTGEALAFTMPGDNKPAGKLLVRAFDVEVRPSFLDYLSAGTEMSFLVAVDFTGSNGNPADPSSLHYMHPNGQPTAYEEAIVGIARVLEAYDSDKIFLSYLFGGKPRQQGAVVQHCAPLGAGGDPQCHGINGVLQAYRQALQAWQLSGPTLFTPLLRVANQMASVREAHLKYNVLLILTDGCIHDMQDTIDTLVEGSNLPLSILIVGIGNSEELKNMEVLDADDHPLVSRRKVKASRDLVQFVKFADHRNDGTALANECLAELPGQFLEWVRQNKVPLPQRPATGAPPV